MAKIKTVTKEINGTKYTAQFNGISAALKAIDESYIDGSNNTSMIKLAEYLFKHVIVDPKVQIDDFDNMEEFNEVVAFAREVMQGDFREEKDESTADTKGKK